MASRHASFLPAMPLFAADVQPGGSPVSSPWLRFSWQVSTLPAAPVGSDLIRKATREEGEDVLRVLLLSLSMDSAWNDFYAQTDQYLKDAVARLFNAGDPLCLVIPKGNRIIAASLLDPDPEAANHLVSGPSVLMEYRNRGIGSRLLHASLSTLAEVGLKSVCGITREKSVAAKNVYPKFGGVSESIQLGKQASKSLNPAP